jgi:hypothetical protein
MRETAASSIFGDSGVEQLQHLLLSFSPPSFSYPASSRTVGTESAASALVRVCTQSTDNQSNHFTLHAIAFCSKENKQ